MSNDFDLLMISAMYENGGNTVHRFLDGHPQLCVYPFESQLGTRLVSDALSSLYPSKYRWPCFPLHGTPEEDYRAIQDEELKIRARTPNVSKFRHFEFNLSDDERARIYAIQIAARGRSRGNNVAAFFRATFEAWKDFRRSGAERVYVGYSPIVVVDADKILEDFPAAHILHVVRNPWSAYADTCRRPVPLSLANYLLGWTTAQDQALLFRELFPNRVHIVRLEDVLGDPAAALGQFCRRIGLDDAPSLRQVTWNGTPLETVYPWGTIRTPTLEANTRTARELSKDETEQVRIRAGRLLETLDYKNSP